MTNDGNTIAATAGDLVPPTMTATWAGGLRFVHRSASGHGLVTDAPGTDQGESSAPSPMELVLLGLIGCTGVDVASILQRMREPLEGLEVTATYERAETHPKVYTKIHLTYSLRGGLDEKKVRRAIELSESKYCSVSAMLGTTSDITSEYVLNS
jgi:putative redox protein